MPEAARHKRAQLLEHKSAGRNSSPPDTRLQVVETRGFRLPSRSRTVEALRRVEITNLWRYPLKASLPPLSLSRPFIPRICFTVPFGETAAEDSRFDICWPPLRECVEQWQPPSSIVILFFLRWANGGENWDPWMAPILARRRTSMLDICPGIGWWTAVCNFVHGSTHFNERVTNDDAFSLIVFVFLPLSLLRIICRSIGSNGRNFLVSFFFLLYLIENCFIYSSY